MSADRAAVHALGAPQPRGPYSPAVRYGDLLFCSGALGTTPDGTLVSTSVRAETTQCLANLEAICAAAGTSLLRALKLTVYVTDMSTFAEVNSAFAQFFAAEPPARATVGISQLLGDSRVEVDAIVAC